MRQPGKSTPALPPLFEAPTCICYALVIVEEGETSVRGLGEDPDIADHEAAAHAASWDGDPLTRPYVALIKLALPMVEESEAQPPIFLESKRYQAECLDEGEWDRRFGESPTQQRSTMLEPHSYTTLRSQPTDPEDPTTTQAHHAMGALLDGIVRTCTLSPDDAVPSVSAQALERKSRLVDALVPLLKDKQIDERVLKAMLGRVVSLAEYTEAELEDLLNALQYPHDTADAARAKAACAGLDVSSLDALHESWTRYWKEAMPDLHPRVRRVVFAFKEAKKEALFAQEKEEKENPTPTPAPLPSAGAGFDRVEPCKSCRAPMRWGRSENGKDVPVDAHGHAVTDVRPEGNNDKPRKLYLRDIKAGVLRLTDTWPAYPGAPGTLSGYLSHHATCPDAAKYRNKGKK